MGGEVRAGDAATASAGRQAFVHAAEVDLQDGADPAAMGAAVTVALCGHWEHDGVCRWPHNSHVDTSGTPAQFRTLFVAPEPEEGAVRERIDKALENGDGWSVRGASARPVAEHELGLAQRLLDHDGGR